MAHVSIHEVIAQLYMRKNKNEINDEIEFIKGSVAPDLTEDLSERLQNIYKHKTHYGKWSNGETETNIDKFLEDQNIDINKDYWKGYFLHLMTDHYFYNKCFVKEFENMKKDKGSFRIDCDFIFEDILKKYNLELSIYTSKYINIQKGEPQYLKLDKVIEFIEKISDMSIQEKIAIIKQKGMEDLE